MSWTERPTVDARSCFELSSGYLIGIGPLPAPLHLIMDRAYEDNETRQLALDFGFIPIVPPQEQSSATVAVRQGPLPQAKRSGTALSPTQGLPSHLLSLRQTRRPLSWISQLRLNRRGPTIVLTRPSFDLQPQSKPLPRCRLRVSCLAFRNQPRSF